MKEVLKLALEALTNAIAVRNGEGGTKLVSPLEENAITAIKEALAQPEQEPVAWGFRHHDGAIYDCISPEAHADCEGEYNVPLYDAPPKRPWVGLTDAEMQALWDRYAHMEMMRAIEAKLKEKNFD